MQAFSNKTEMRESEAICFALLATFLIEARFPSTLKQTYRKTKQNKTKNKTKLFLAFPCNEEKAV
jgi:hypothetical protein